MGGGWRGTSPALARKCVVGVCGDWGRAGMSLVGKVGLRGVGVGRGLGVEEGGGTLTLTLTLPPFVGLDMCFVGQRVCQLGPGRQCARTSAPCLSLSGCLSVCLSPPPLSPSLSLAVSPSLCGCLSLAPPPPPPPLASRQRL